MSNGWLFWPKLAGRCTYRRTLRESWLELPKSLHLVSGYVSALVNNGIKQARFYMQDSVVDQGVCVV